MKSKKIIIAALAATALTSGIIGSTGTAAFAASESVGGGTWNYGNTMGRNYSDYFHSTSDHSATVICGNSKQRILAPAGKWANAWLPAISGCSFYWSVL